MKIRFVKGTCTVNKLESVWCSHFNSYVCRYWLHAVTMKAKKLKEEIIIVKQKSMWYNFIILTHELLHALVHRFISKDVNCRAHDWIDKYL